MVACWSLPWASPKALHTTVVQAPLAIPTCHPSGLLVDGAKDRQAAAVLPRWAVQRQMNWQAPICICIAGAPAGNVCVLYTTTPSADLIPNSNTATVDACECYRACREEYTCDGRVFCPSGANRKDCRDGGVFKDFLGGTNPCT
jgi:hypothetical protein